LEFVELASLGCTVVRPYLFLKLVFVAFAPGLIKGEVNPLPDILAAAIGDFLPAIFIIESLSAILSNFIGDLSVFENLGLLSDYYDLTS
jgi:hypothetical protein